MFGEHSHPEISMHTYPLANYLTHIRSGNWEQVSALMLRSAEKLAECGAEFAICPDNTVHQAFDIVVEGSPIPWLNIADCVAASARSRGFRTIGLTGTKTLMTGPVYSDALNRHGLDQAIPDLGDRERIDEIIFTELVYGVINEESRQYFNRVFRTLKDRGCDAVVLGCTEIPLLVDPSNTPLPTLDSTRLLAKAALDRAGQPGW